MSVPYPCPPCLLACRVRIADQFASVCMQSAKARAIQTKAKAHVIQARYHATCPAPCLAPAHEAARSACGSPTELHATTDQARGRRTAAKQARAEAMATKRAALRERMAQAKANAAYSGKYNQKKAGAAATEGAAAEAAAATKEAADQKAMAALGLPTATGTESEAAPPTPPEGVGRQRRQSDPDVFAGDLLPGDVYESDVLPGDVLPGDVFE